MLDGTDGRSEVGEDTTYRSDSTGSRDGAHGTRGLSESVPKHSEANDWEARRKREQLQRRAIEGERRLEDAMMPLREVEWRFSGEE